MGPPQVADLEVRGGIEEKVSGLQGSMNDTRTVQIFEAPKNLKAVLQSEDFQVAQLLNVLVPKEVFMSENIGDEDLALVHRFLGLCTH
jgi:hypothetical protein